MEVIPAFLPTFESFEDVTWVARIRGP